MHNLGLTLFLVLVACGIAGWLISYLFYRRLRTYHRRVWTELGSPTLFYNASMKNQASVARFLWGNHYKKLEDRYLHNLALALRILGLVAIGLFLLAVVLTLIKGSPI